MWVCLHQLGLASGRFRTAAKHLAPYNNTVGAFCQRMTAGHGQQKGDPAKAAQAILTLVNAENPPLRLPLGKVALTIIQAKIDQVQQDLNASRVVAAGAVFGQ